jgi:hypothetical protein
MSKDIERKVSSAESVASGKERSRFEQASEALVVQIYKRKVITGDEVNIEDLRLSVARSLRKLFHSQGLDKVFGIDESSSEDK